MSVRFIFVYSMAFLLNGLCQGGVNVCTDVSKLNVVVNSYLENWVYQELLDVSLMTCIRACGLQGSCLSYNYYVSTSVCHLNGANGSVSPLTGTSELVVYGERQFLPQRFLRCGNLTCPVTKTCMGDNGKEECVLTDCGYPPSVQSATRDVSVQDVGLQIGSIMTYTCTDKQSLPVGEQKCLLSGKWSQFVCYSKNCNAAYSDGEYWFYHSDTPDQVVKIYCHGMSTANPKEFVSLPNPSISQQFIDGDDTLCKQTEKIAGTIRRRCGELTFDKIALKNYGSLQVDDADWTFASTTCDYYYLMALGDCSLKADCTLNTSLDQAYIDTHGTSFIIPVSKLWKTTKGTKNAVFTYQRSDDNKAINITLKAGCGGYAHAGKGLNLEFDPLNGLKSDEATFPVC